ncbi:hypothetical protein [Polymorphospora rubra]
MESAMPPGQSGMHGQRSAYGPGGPVPRVRRLRLALSVLGGMIALLCVGGAGVVYVAYDTVTQPDRSAPDVVVDNYLRATFTNRDDLQAEAFLCEAPANIDLIHALRDEIDDREMRFGVDVVVTWSSLTPHNATEEAADVEVGLVITGQSDGQVRSRRSETWSFSLRRESRDWQICSVTTA